MSQRRLQKIMTYQLKRAAAGNPHLVPHVDETDCRKWSFLICNLPPPYEGGEYMFCLTATDEFPRKPPVFTFLTPNGVYRPGGKICISIGEFHAGDKAGKTGSYGWRPALGMIGFAQEVVNGMLVPESLGGGIRVISESPPAVKIAHARESVAFNQKKHPKLVADFEEFFASNPDHPAARARVAHRAKVGLLAHKTGDSVLKHPEMLSRALGTIWPLVEPAVAGYQARPAPPHIEAAMRGVLGCRGEETRRVLALGVAALVATEAGEGAARAYPAAFARFQAELPAVCGGRCREIVPNAISKLSQAPNTFLAVYPSLEAFVASEDIDKKAGMGEALVKSLEGLEAAGAARAYPAAFKAVQSVGDADAAPATPAASAVPDEFIDELISGI